MASETTRLRKAKLKVQACVEDIDYQAQRGLSKTVIKQLMACSWLNRKENLLITGPTGTGKTWLSCALANQACRSGYSALYLRMPRLFQQIELAKADGSFPMSFIRPLSFDCKEPNRVVVTARRVH